MPTPDQIRILTVVAFVLLMLLGIKRPVYAVAAYMVLVYCKLSSYYPFFAQIKAESVFAVVILLRLVAAGTLLNGLSLKLNPINKYVLWLVFCVVLSFAVAWDHQYSWDHAVYHFIKTLLLYAMIVGAVVTLEDLKTFLWAFILMFAYLAYEPTFNYLSGSGGSQYMYGTNYIADIGLLSGHVALANNVNQMIPIVVFLFMGVQVKWQKIVLAICFLVFFIALVGSGSRGGIVGMLIWASCIVWFSEKRAKMAMVACVLMSVLLVGYGSSIMHTAGRIDSSSARGRFIGLTHGIGMLTKGNIIGVGPGNYLIARQQYFGWRMESHNIYGQVMGDLGLPGMIVTFLLVREIFRGINRVKNRLKNQREEPQLFLYYLMAGVQVSLITRLGISMASHGLYFFYWYVMAAFVVVSLRLLDQGGIGNNSQTEVA
jgi:hypothetical protein